jgi:hypothetical protein
MTSLKAFAPVLARALGLTPAAIYERQRALIRANVLPAPERRGRGHGLDANAETVAWMIIAAMATDNLSETDDRVQKLARARFRKALRRDADGCVLTGARSFQHALVEILDSEKLSAAVFRIRVVRHSLTASIAFFYGSRGSVKSSVFGGVAYPRPKFMMVESSISGEVLLTIGNALRASPSQNVGVKR